ncbi:MAG: GerMN domain-containing protein [Anaerolineae bacterium]|jgi:hypothetical protein|nr:GerMN domain-containing protein [Anaerolineae bacterium]
MTPIRVVMGLCGLWGLLTGCISSPLASTPQAQTAAASLPLHFYAIHTDQTQGTPIGCDQAAVMIDSALVQTGQLSEDLRLALIALFTTPLENFPDYRNAWTHRGISLDGVTITGDQAVIALRSDQALRLEGVCSDAALRAQLLLTVFQFSPLQSALITYNGENLKQLMDASGIINETDRFTRADLGYNQ